MTIAGYDREPDGRLLEQRLELGGEMGLAYERAIGFLKPSHTHDRPMLVCPRGTCRMVVATEAERFALDGRRVLWMPRDVVHDNACHSAIYDTLALFPAAREIDRALAANRLGSRERDHLRTTPFVLARTGWLDELLERYFAERVLGRHSPRDSRRILERQILDELIWLAFRDRLQPGVPRGRDRAPDELRAALDYIEAHLFDQFELDELATAARLSGSTLLRRFRALLEVTPAEYVRNRRLDEARALLARGDHEVGDVALLVGYDEPSAFGRAFRRRFGHAPSAARDQPGGLPDRPATARKISRRASTT